MWSETREHTAVYATNVMCANACVCVYVRTRVHEFILGPNHTAILYFHSILHKQKILNLPLENKITTYLGVMDIFRNSKQNLGTVIRLCSSPAEGKISAAAPPDPSQAEFLPQSREQGSKTSSKTGISSDPK